MKKDRVVLTLSVLMTMMDSRTGLWLEPGIPEETNQLARLIRNYSKLSYLDLVVCEMNNELSESKGDDFPQIEEDGPGGGPYFFFHHLADAHDQLLFARRELEKQIVFLARRARQKARKAARRKSR